LRLVRAVRVLLLALLVRRLLRPRRLRCRARRIPLLALALLLRRLILRGPLLLLLPPRRGRHLVWLYLGLRRWLLVSRSRGRRIVWPRHLVTRFVTIILIPDGVLLVAVARITVA